MLSVQRVQNLKQHLAHDPPYRAPVGGELLGRALVPDVAVEPSKRPENSIIRSLTSFAIRASRIMMNSPA